MVLIRARVNQFTTTPSLLEDGQDMLSYGFGITANMMTVRADGDSATVGTLAARNEGYG